MNINSSVTPRMNWTIKTIPSMKNKLYFMNLLPSIIQAEIFASQYLISGIKIHTPASPMPTNKGNKLQKNKPNWIDFERNKQASKPNRRKQSNLQKLIAMMSGIKGMFSNTKPKKKSRKPPSRPDSSKNQEAQKRAQQCKPIRAWQEVEP